MPDMQIEIVRNRVDSFAFNSIPPAYALPTCVCGFFFFFLLVDRFVVRNMCVQVRLNRIILSRIQCSESTFFAARNRGLVSVIRLATQPADIADRLALALPVHIC